MNLLPETSEILAVVERKTGTTVEFFADPALPVAASVKIANRNLPCHLLSFNPNKPEIDYHVAYGCGFILRLVECAPERRYVFAGVNAAESAVREQLARCLADKRLTLPPDALAHSAKQLYDALMTQLRSIPIGMRIDQWLWEQYPGLRELQRVSLAKQQQENVSVLNPQLAEITPPLVFSAIVSMNAVHALFCDRLLGQLFFAVAYRSAGFDILGDDLIKIWDATPSEATHDRDLVDAWAKQLEISGWYQWLPYK